MQSPVGASAAGEKAKTVFSSIISPVLTLFQGKQEGKPGSPALSLRWVHRNCSPFSRFPAEALWQRVALFRDQLRRLLL